MYDLKSIAVVTAQEQLLNPGTPTADELTSVSIAWSPAVLKQVAEVIWLPIQIEIVDAYHGISKRSRLQARPFCGISAEFGAAFKATLLQIKDTPNRRADSNSYIILTLKVFAAACLCLAPIFPKLVLMSLDALFIGGLFRLSIVGLSPFMLGNP